MIIDEIASFLEQAYAQAPAPVRAFLADGGFEAFLAKAQDMGFHVDAMGKISDETLMMLLGMSDPREYASNLEREAGLTGAESAALIALANREIFTPINERMRGASGRAPEAPVVPQADGSEWVRVSPPPQASVPSYAPPARQSVSELERASPSLPAVPPPHELAVVPASAPREMQGIQEHTPMVPDTRPVVPGARPARPIMPHAPAAPSTYDPAPHSAVRTMAADMEALHEGHRPAPQPYVPHNLPGQEPSAPTELPARPAPPPSQPQAAYTRPYLPSEPSRPAPGIPAVKKSGVVPYREPIDET